MIRTSHLAIAAADIPFGRPFTQAEITRIHPPIHVATRINQCQRILPKLTPEGQRAVVNFMYQRLSEERNDG